MISGQLEREGEMISNVDNQIEKWVKYKLISLPPKFSL